MTHRIIINPYANRWRAQQQIDSIRTAYSTAGVDFEIVLTTRALEATELAQDAVTQGYSAIVAAGGDGTINEVVNGLVQASNGDAPTLPLGIIPIGTGNDLADMLPIPRDIEAAVANITAGKSRQIDIGRVLIDGNEAFFFDNNSAIALEAKVGVESNRFTKLHGTPRYLVALMMALARLEAWEMTIEWEGGRFEGKSMLLSVCNGPRNGSTFMMAPDAKVDDGLFDVVLAPDLKLPTILRILPGLFNGTHLNHPKVTHFRTPWLKIACQGGTPIHADGEMLSNSAESIHYSILPKKLTLLSKPA